MFLRLSATKHPLVPWLEASVPNTSVMQAKKAVSSPEAEVHTIYDTTTTRVLTKGKISSSHQNIHKLFPFKFDFKVRNS